jgi:hypothetical protein
VAFALVIVVWAFGWAGGKLLVEQSYADAKVKVAEQKEQRAARRTRARTIATAPAAGDPRRDSPGEEGS